MFKNNWIMMIFYFQLPSLLLFHSQCSHFIYVFIFQISLSLAFFFNALSQAFIKCSGLPWWLRWYRLCLHCRRPRFNPWVGKIPLEKKMIHASIVWRIPWAEESDGQQFMRLHRVMTELLTLSSLSLYQV